MDLLPRADLKIVVDAFLADSASPDHRYASFDYCYNYFCTVPDVAADMERSCLALGFYLASWGMLRGSSFLLGKSAKHFERVVEYIGELDRKTWLIDVDSYTAENTETIISIYHGIKERLIPGGERDLVLTTKVLLGVLGFVPAFDNYFTSTFRTLFAGRCGFRSVSKESLSLVAEFYDSNEIAIDTLASNTFTTDFKTGQKTNIHYPKAKIIDMYGFAAGLSKGLPTDTPS